MKSLDKEPLIDLIRRLDRLNKIQHELDTEYENIVSELYNRFPPLKDEIKSKELKRGGKK